MLLHAAAVGVTAAEDAADSPALSGAVDDVSTWSAPLAAAAALASARRYRLRRGRMMTAPATTNQNTMMLEPEKRWRGGAAGWGGGERGSQSGS